MLRRTLPWAIVTPARSFFSPSSFRTAKCRCLGMILVVLLPRAAFPANRRISVVSRTSFLLYNGIHKSAFRLTFLPICFPWGQAKHHRISAFVKSRHIVCNWYILHFRKIDCKEKGNNSNKESKSYLGVVEEVRKRRHQASSKYSIRQHPGNQQSDVGISGLIYEENRGVPKVFLINVICEAVTYIVFVVVIVSVTI